MGDLGRIEGLLSVTYGSAYLPFKPPTTRGNRDFGLQVACWPTKDGDPENRVLNVLVAEIFTDPDTIAIMRLLSPSPGYHPMEISIDEESLGIHGWLLAYEEGPVDNYYYSETFTATADVSKDVVDALASPDVHELIATWHVDDISDIRTFDVRGSDEALKPVLSTCRQ